MPARIQPSTLSIRPRVLEHLAAENPLTLQNVRVWNLFVTTPNCWLPIDFIQSTACAYGCRSRCFASSCTKWVRAFLPSNLNLNLLANANRRFTGQAALRISTLISRQFLLCGWPSNLLLIGRRARKRQASRRDHRRANAQPIHVTTMPIAAPPPAPHCEDDTRICYAGLDYSSHFLGRIIGNRGRCGFSIGTCA